jgi:kumamolisin
VWNAQPRGGATGGGVSNVFALPTWQSGAGVPKPTNPAGGRGVPDVAGDADPATGYMIRVDGSNMVIGGTSAVAPLYAGLLALANQQNGRSAGFINPTIYTTKAKGAFRDITAGNNGNFPAATGWDPCTGLGSPIAPQFITAVKPAKSVAKPPKSRPSAASKKSAKRKPSLLRRRSS